MMMMMMMMMEEEVGAVFYQLFLSPSPARADSMHTCDLCDDGLL